MINDFHYKCRVSCRVQVDTRIPQGSKSRVMQREYVEAAIVIRNDYVEMILGIYAGHNYSCAFS